MVMVGSKRTAEAQKLIKRKDNLILFVNKRNSLPEIETNPESTIFQHHGMIREKVHRMKIMTLNIFMN
jgi:hypothetical protein